MPGSTSAPAAHLVPVPPQDRRSLHDLGELPGPSGLVLRRGRVWWADAEHPVDTARLGVRTAIELRAGWAPREVTQRAAGCALTHYVLRAPGSDASVEALRETVGRVLGVIAAPDSQPVLLTSTAGPEPLRVVVATLLEMLGVPRDVGSTARIGGMEAGTPAWSVTEVALADVDAAGGAQSWWTAAGQPPWAVEALRATLLEPACDTRSGARDGCIAPH